MASFATRVGGRELLALALAGRLSDGTELPGIHPLLLARVQNNGTMASASQLVDPVPVSAYSATPIPRTPSAWSVGTRLDGGVFATPAPFTANITETVPTIAAVAFAVKPTMGTDNLVLAVVDTRAVLGASPRQVATFTATGIGLRPAPANGRSLHTRAGLGEFLHLGFRGTTSTGSGLSSVYGHLIRSTFSWPAATPDTSLEELAPHLVPAEHLSAPPTFERATGTWTFGIDTEGRGYARPAAPRSFAYLGATTITTNGLALTTSPTASGAGTLLALIETTTQTLEPGNTCELSFSVVSP